MSRPSPRPAHPLLLLTGAIMLGLCGAAEPILVGDINNAGGGIGDAAIVDGAFYFAYTSATHGRELWHSDGTPGGTALLADIAPDAASSSPESLTRIGASVWLSADDGTSGRELWIVADGTAELVDLHPGAAGSDPQLFTRAGDRVFFSAVDDAGRELWVADLDGGEARRVVDLHSGSASGLAAAGAFSRFAAIAPLADGVLVIADDGASGDELWYSDGSDLQLIADLAGGTASPNFTAAPQAANGLVFFTSNVAGGGFEPYVADTDGAGRLRDINPDSNSWPFTYYGLGDDTFFTAQPKSGEHHLYVTDGSGTNTRIFSGYTEADVFIVGATDERLYLSANKTALWSTDGSTATELVEVDDPRQVVDLDGTSVCFLADRGERNYRLMSWTPGQAAAVELGALDPAGAGVIEGQTRLYGDGGGAVFAVTSNALGEDVLYGSRGNAASTRLLSVPEVGDGSSTPTDLIAVGETVFFQATPTTTGSPENRWFQGSLADGVAEVADLRPGADGWGAVDEIHKARLIGELIFFAGRDGEHGQEPWILDTTSATLRPIGDLRSGGDPSSPRFFRRVGEQVLFAARGDGMSRQTLWRCGLDGSDPTAVVDSGTVPQDPREPLVWNEHLYFTAEAGDGRELWVSDGSADGTRQLADIAAGGADGLPYNPNGRRFAPYDGSTLMIFDDALWFPADDGDGFGLWRYDGADVERFADHLAAVSHPTAVGDEFFFRADDGSTGAELWASDGTASGTRLVKDIHPATAGSDPIWLTAVGARCFFVADDGTSGREVWVSDGTADGTRMIADINAAGDSRATQLIAVGSTCCFVADDGVHGPELWQSRGDPANTGLVVDFRPGRTGGSIFNTQVGGEAARHDAAVIGNTLYFPANSPATGSELWAFTPEDGDSPMRRVGLNAVDSWPGAEASHAGERRTLPTSFSTPDPARDRLVEFHEGPDGDG